ncbi:MAG: T9SS type A sorting domain-containing protein [Bacteroidetes bacterium]|nr:T9SS type A sorting domain-containing protein [Bacteroidota bacterium]
MRETFTRFTVIIILFLSAQCTANAQKRIYVANDDHTDYMWVANEIDYDSAFLHMLDWWMDYNDATKLANPGNYNLQSKWNCDGSFWVKEYQKYRTASQFDRLINQIKAGQITIPYSPLIATYGGVPAEAIIRGMYYAGSLERQYNLDLSMAAAIENQTLPLGLASLWKGAGAKYCWYGVCDCYTSVTGLGSRQNQMYWYKGLDTNKVLLKWYNLKSPGVSDDIGGYAEVRHQDAAINDLSAQCNTTAYPYNVVGGFGVGHDGLETEQDYLVGAAQINTNASQSVIVSNEVDFFKDFENTYGSSLPAVTQTFGNEWDLACVSIAEVSARVKRDVEKLRAAEAMAAIITNFNPTYAGTLDSLRKEAWMSLGLYWEHDFGFTGPTITLDERNAFERRLETTITSYVTQLYNLSRSNLSDLITSDAPANERFFAFNPLGWKRTSFADYAYSGTNAKVVDVTTNTDIPAQLITRDGTQYLRILADSIPSIGYKVYEIQSGANAFNSSWFSTGVNGSFKYVENDSFKVTYTNQGVITSLIDKHNGNTELVATGNYINNLGSGNLNTGTAVIENSGPVSVTILATATTPVAHKTRITLYKNVARVEIDNQITQNFTDNKTWTFGFNIANPEVWHEETGAVIRAKLTNNAGHYAVQNARYDWNTLNHFVSVNDTVTHYGVSISNEDCYFMQIGNSTTNFLDQNSATIKVLAGGRIDALSGGGYPMGIEDQGGDILFNQRFAITTHTDYSAVNEMKKALEHQDSIVCGAVYNPVNFLLPNQYAFITNDDPNALIWAVKPAEEGLDGGTITRIWNLGSSNVSSNLNFSYNLTVNDAKRTSLVETNMSSIAFSPGGRIVPVTLGHDEMRAFRIKLAVIPLAAQSVTLEGGKAGTANQLHWMAANETGYKSYILQRSTDGQHFIDIASVPSKSTLNSSYDYADKNLNIAIPFYYRLRVINTDNNSASYSNTILIKAAKESFNIVLFPNPAVEVVKVNFILDKQTRCNVAVYNTEGKLVKTVAPPLFERGNNYFTLPVKDLPAGEYIFTVDTGEKKFTKSFVKTDRR